jgi:hypothetical protein
VITDNHPYNEFFRSLPDDDTRPDFGSLRRISQP